MKYDFKDLYQPFIPVSVYLFIFAMCLSLGMKSLSIFLQIKLETAGPMPPSKVDLLFSSEEQSSCFTALVCKRPYSQHN